MKGTFIGLFGPRTKTNLEPLVQPFMCREYFSRQNATSIPALETKFDFGRHSEAKNSSIISTENRPFHEKDF